MVTVCTFISIVGFVKDRKDPFVYTPDKSTKMIVVVDRLKMNKRKRQAAKKNTLPVNSFFKIQNA